MKNFTRLIFILLNVFSSNHVFAANFYYQTDSKNTEASLILGDSSFAYSLNHNLGVSEETFEKGLTRITILRDQSKATMWIEQRTKVGFLTFKYKPSGRNWENTEITFRRYNTFYKGIVGSGCNDSPTTKNQNSISDVINSSDYKNFENKMFDKSCRKNLSTQEFNNLVSTTYNLLNEDLGETKPPIMTCVGSQGNLSKIRDPFTQLRARIPDLVKKSSSVEDVKKDTLVPFPISCDFDGKAKKLCGAASEGQKTKISFDAKCLKGKSASKDQTIALFMHEFTHTLRFPKSENSKQLVPLSEKQVQQIDAGICNPMDILFANVGETDMGKDKVVATENAKSTGAQKLAGDVANPYSSFAERATTPTTTQTTTVASTEPSSGATEVGGGGSGSSGVVAQQRSIASTNAFNVGSNRTSSNSTYSVPSIQQQAQYQNVKTYVDASVNTVAKKIAPIVSYVESPAFAKTLPPTSFENSNSGDPAASVSASTGAVVAKSAAINRAAGNAARSGEVAASSGGGSGEVVSGNSANLGSSSSSASSSRSPAAVNKSINRLSSTDTNLDNQYALKVRKKLLSDESYRKELRSKGVQIEFADGYKFETPASKITYTEKNGVLVRGK